MIHNYMWKSKNDEFEALSVLSNISRYNTRYRIKNESVAAHSFYTTWFASRICSDMGLSPEITMLAMEAAMVHDIPEIYINDITYDCKKMIPELEDILIPYESQIVESLSTDAADILFRPETTKQKLINAIVRYADVLSVEQYSLSEVKLGNKSFYEIYEGASKRLSEIQREMEKYLKEFKEEE